MQGPKRRSPIRKPQRSAGKTTATDTRSDTDDLPLPHERDEASDASHTASKEKIEHAAHDLAKGQVDTDRRQDATEVFRNSGKAPKPAKRPV